MARDKSKDNDKDKDKGKTGPSGVNSFSALADSAAPSAADIMGERATADRNAKKSPPLPLSEEGDPTLMPITFPIVKARTVDNKRIGIDLLQEPSAPNQCLHDILVIFK